MKFLKFRVAANTEFGQSSFSKVLENSTSAECPSQLYKPTLKKLAKMDAPDESTTDGYFQYEIKAIYINKLYSLFSITYINIIYIYNIVYKFTCLHSNN